MTKWETLIKNYEPGHIVSLNVLQKDFIRKLVLFELEGVEVQLAINEISNSPSLSKKLFDVIQIEEAITTVIIDFNKHEKNIQVSLLPFRDNLEGSLSFTKCRKIIEKRREKRVAQDNDFLEENRNQLDRIQGDLAKVDLTFLFELIQNAIDHPNPQFNNHLSIQFELYKDYLLLKHNGSIFNEDNFRSLTGILLGEKTISEDRVGYKGIGFKSIFRYSQEVYIRSGNFSFSFSKSRTGGELPWEVIPVFENEIDKVEEIRNFDFFNSPVAFAFKFTNHELKLKATSYLHKLIDNPEALLFLNNLHQLEIIVDGVSKKIIRSVEVFDKGYKKISLQLNEEKPLIWLICEETETIIDEDIIAELKDENNPSIPLKFRDFRKPKIQIAFPFIPKDDLINLYSYLPLSETIYGLPYVINGDFIPNLDRTDLIKNLEYNNYLSDLGSRVLVNLFRVISLELGLDRAFELIPSVDEFNIDFIDDVISKFITKKDELSVLHCSGNETLLSRYVIDESELFQIIEHHELNKLEAFNDSVILTSNYSHIEEQLTSKFGIKKITLDHAFEIIDKKSFKEAYFNSEKSIILFLYRLSRLTSYEDWKRYINSYKFIGPNYKFSLSDLHYNIPEEHKQILKSTLKINSLDNSLNKKLTRHSRIRELFFSFGLSEYNLSNTLVQLDKKKKAIITDIGDNTNLLDNIWAFLYLNKDEINSDGGRLVNHRFLDFPIKTVNNSIEPLKSCFVGGANSSGIKYSGLYDNFGQDDLTKVDISEIAKLSNVKEFEIVEFLATIHKEIKITDAKLFNQTLTEVLLTPLEKFEEEDPNKLISALVSVFYYTQKYPNRDLLAKGLINFPVICNDNSIEKIGFTYFSNDYEDYFDKNEMLAEQIFNGISSIKYISKGYLRAIPTKKHKAFVKFLESCCVSLGIKVVDAQLIKKNNRINITSIDSNYSGYNRGYTNFRSTSEFNIVKDLSKLSGRYDNLILFWSEFINNYNQLKIIENISCNGYPRDNPFFYLVKKPELDLFPMATRFVVKSYTNVNSLDLSPYLLDGSLKLNPCFNEIPKELLEKLSFRLILGKDAIIKCLQNLKQLTSNDDIESLILDYFSKTTFTEEELNKLRDSCFFVAKDRTIVSYDNLIYIDKTIEESRLYLSLIDFNPNQIIESYDFNSRFKSRIEKIGVPIYSKNNIELRGFQEHKTIYEFINQVLDDFFVKNTKVSFLPSKYSFKRCSEIEIGLNDIEGFKAKVDGYYDEAKQVFYYSDLRDLAELLSEKLGLSQKENRILRKKLESEIKRTPHFSKKQKKKIIKATEPLYSDVEIEQIKTLFGRNLDASELTEENLFAQVKALRYFQDKQYNTHKAEDNFEDNYGKRFLYPVLKPNGDSIKVLCRSARKGILFLGAFAWEVLGDENAYMYILTGDSSSDCLLIANQEELETKLQSHYKVMRQSNSDYESVRNIVNAEKNLEDLQFLYKVKDGSYDIIFNPQQNTSGERGGPLLIDDSEI